MSNSNKIEAFDEWLEHYYSSTDILPSVDEIRLALDAWEAGFNYAKRCESQSE